MLTSKLKNPMRLAGICLSLGLAGGCLQEMPVPGGSGGTGTGGNTTGTPGPNACAAQVHTGDVVVNEPAGVEALKGVTHVVGSLVLDAGALGAASALNCLEQVDGDLTLRGNEFRKFNPDVLAALTSLRRVGGALTLDRIMGLARPGLASLQTVGGDLRIINNPDLVDLGGLEQLTSVQGQLMVARNPRLVSMDGLAQVGQAAEVLVLENPSLTRVGGLAPLVKTGRLKFSRNPLLQNLAGLENVTHVEALVLEDNDAMVDLRALAKLTTVDLELLILGNAALQSIEGLGALAQVPPRLEIEDNARLQTLDGLATVAAPANPEAVFRIANNPVLTKLGPWQHWVHGSGELYISGNPLLATLSGLENLSSIGALTLHGPDQLPDLQGLPKLQKVERRLSLGNREQWTAINGLSALSELGELELVGMKQLSDLSRFKSVGNIESLRLFSLPSLTSLASFSHLRSMQGDLWLDDMVGLPSLGGLEGLTEVKGRLIVSKVKQLQDLTQLSALRSVGSVIVANNEQLKNLEGLGGLTTLTQEEGGLCIHQNPVMTQIDALSGLNRVQGSVTLTENPILENMNGMSGLTEIGLSLWIDGSPKVQTLEPFSKLRKLGGRAWGFDDTCPGVLAPRDADAVQPQPYHGFMGIEVRMMNVVDLKGFEDLEVIKGGISIKENPLMTDLSALYDSRVEGVTVEVRLNPKMDQCHALSLTGKLSFYDGGDIRIWDNLGVDEPDCG